MDESRNGKFGKYMASSDISGIEFCRGPSRKTAKPSQWPGCHERWQRLPAGESENGKFGKWSKGNLEYTLILRLFHCKKAFIIVKLGLNRYLQYVNIKAISYFY